MEKKFMPSSGTEGYGFIETYCTNCIHEKFIHTNNHADKTCPIMNASLINGEVDEWVIIEGKPRCKCFKRWDWGFDDDGNFNEPPDLPIFDDPNQLCFPFIFDEIGIAETKHFPPQPQYHQPQLIQ
jgi:hypothetical protein